MKLLERCFLPIKRNRGCFIQNIPILVSKSHKTGGAAFQEMDDKLPPWSGATARFQNRSTLRRYMYISTFFLGVGVWGSSSYRSFTPHTILTVRPWKWMVGRRSGFLLGNGNFSGAILNLGGLKKKATLRTSTSPFKVAGTRCIFPPP